MTTPSPKKILMLGGTRFIGVYLARMLVDQGHEVTLMTRGKSPIAVQIPDDTDEYFASYESAINHIAVDRKDADAVESKLKGTDFDVVYDINAREKEDQLARLEDECFEALKEAVTREYPDLKSCFSALPSECYQGRIH